MRYRYSKDIVYNNFPFIVPKKESRADSELLRNSNKTETSLDVSNPCGNFLKCIGQQAQKIEQTAQAILDARAKYPDCTFADLYGENSYLFPELVKAHEANDRAVMQAYGFDTNMTEAEIVAELFKMYEKLAK